MNNEEGSSIGNMGGPILRGEGEFKWIKDGFDYRLDYHLEGINIGFAIVRPGWNYNWLDNLEVAPSHRRMGIY